MHGTQVKGPIENAGMVFQDPVLLPWRRALENILFVAEMRGVAAENFVKRAQELMIISGLQGFEKKFPYQLSGGMQQRVSICRAVLLEPSVLLMDEPFGALDVMTREKMGFELLKIYQAIKTTVLFVTHSIAESVLLSDRVLVMSARPGKIMKTISVDLPRPRDQKTFRDPKYQEYLNMLRDALEVAHLE